MTRITTLAAVLAATVAPLAAADAIYTHGSETGSRFNPNQTNLNLQAYTNTYWNTNATGLQIDSLTFGIRRLASAPDVTLHFYVAQMTGTGDFDSATIVDLGTVGLLANGASSITELVTINPGITMALNDLAAGGSAGYAGLYFGIRFEGANASNTANGWRITNAPTLGFTDDYFAAWDPSTSTLAYQWFGGNPVANFYLDINGSFVPAPGAFALLGAAGLVGGRRRRA